MSYQQIRPGGFQVLPPVIKNLIIINGLVLLAQYTTGDILKTSWVTDFFALHSIQSNLFKPHQLITHLFMHGGFTHFFFNMFALWMFGSSLENFWGSKRFLIFYLLCGLGAAGMHLAWLSYDMQPILNAVNVYKQAPNPETFYSFFQKYGVPDNLSLSQLNSFINEWRSNPADSSLISNSITFINEGSQGLISTPTVGASGAVFGCLAAFGYLFPNTLIYLYFFVPVKAKWFVIFYAAAELWMGVTNSGGNVAHFAHLGGALIGFLLVLYWNKNNRKTFY